MWRPKYNPHPNSNANPNSDVIVIGLASYGVQPRIPCSRVRSQRSPFSKLYTSNPIPNKRSFGVMPPRHNKPRRLGYFCSLLGLISMVTVS